MSLSVPDIDDAFIEWIYKHKIKSEQGFRIEFKDHLFMLQPYADMFSQQVMMKSAQVGGSTMSILKSFYLAAEKKMNVIYTLPTVEDVRDFVPAKVDMMATNNPALVSLLGDSDAMGKKQVGDNFIFYRGTSGKKAAIMHTSDCNFYDEYDSCDTNVVDLYTSRLMNSSYKGEMKFSNPTRYGGIDALYDISDQRKWMIKCSQCNRDQALDYFLNVCKERKEYVCSFCDQVLREEDRAKGRWVAMYPTRSDTLHGYHLNQLMVTRQSAKALILLEKTKGNDFFYNMVLGLPYVNATERVDRKTIMGCFRQKDGSRLRNAMGVDVKLGDKHYVLGNADGIFKVGIAKSWEEIEELIERFNPFTVIDANPDFYPRRTMIKKYPGKVFCCIYQKNIKKMELVRWGSGNERGFVNVDRDEMIQHVLDKYDQGKIEINIGLKNPEVVAEGEYREYIRHFENIFKVTRVSERLNIEEFHWEHKGPDDFVHATCYFEIAMDKVRKSDVPVLGFGDIDFNRFAPEGIGANIPYDKIPLYVREEREDSWIYS